MPPPHRPKHEQVVAGAAFGEMKRWESSKTTSMSDVIRGVWQGFKALDRAGFDIVDRRTGEVIPFVDGNVDD